MHNARHVLVLVPVQAQHQKHAQRVVVVVLLQTTKECFRFLSRAVHAVAMASLLKIHVPHVGERELNVALAALAKELDGPGQRVLTVDLATGFDVAADTIADRVHPNDRGAEKIAQRWAEVLIPLLK